MENIEQNITQEFIFSEIIRCKTDPIYFIKTYLKILHPMKGIIPLDLFDFQEDCIIKFVKNRFVIVLKSRQIGLSTISSAYATWLAIFHNSKYILILANKGKVATNLTSMCRTYVKNLPEWLRPKILIDNRQSLEFANNSKIEATNTTPDAARSSALSLLIVDEAAQIKGIEDVWTSARPTLATGGASIVLSTPLGVGNWYHKMWMKAETGVSDDGFATFSPIRLPWWVHPDRDQAWRDRELADLGLMKFSQEYDCSFEKSGNTVIDFETINFYEKNQIREPIEKTGFDHNLWIWEKPRTDLTYIISGDVARGDGSDYCAAHVVSVENMEQVAEYKGKITPDIFAYLLESLGKKYNNALIACENNSMGWATVQKLLDLNYNKIYYSQKMGGVEFINNTDWSKDLQMRIPGFSTTLKTRPLLINVFEESLRTKAFIFHSQRLLDEIKVFIYNEKGKAEALMGYNDDLIMSCGIGLFVRNTTMKLGNITKMGINMIIDNLGSDRVEDTTLSAFMVNVNESKHNPHLSADGSIDYRQFLF